MKIAIVMPEDRAMILKQFLSKHLPGTEILVWPDSKASQCEFAVVWNHPPGLFTQWPWLRAVVSYGAGVDFILRDQQMPQEVSIGRMLDPGLAAQMSSYLLAVVLPRLRNFKQLAQAQQQRRWLPQTRPVQACIGIMGLGHIGRYAAQMFAALGLRVIGWKTHPDVIDGVEVVTGSSGLNNLAENSDYLICTLPLTPNTEGILNDDLFKRMPKHACLINVGRGAHLNESDLITALDQGQISAAVLDVYESEPLPEEHIFWSHPDVTVTPHIAALTDPVVAAEQIAQNFLRFREGKALLNPVGRSIGY